MSELPHTLDIHMARELAEQLFTRDAEGNRLTIDWGEPWEDGFYCPQVMVHRDDNLVAQAQSDLAAQTLRADEAVALCGVLRAALEKVCPKRIGVNGLDGCEDPCEDCIIDRALAATPAEAGERMRRLETFAKYVWKDHLYCGEAGPQKCDHGTKCSCSGFALCKHLSELGDPS